MPPTNRNFNRVNIDVFTRIMSQQSREKVSDKSIIQVIRDHDEPVVQASDVSEHFDITTQAMNYRLYDLVEKDVLDRKKVGSSAVVYWLVG